MLPTEAASRTRGRRPIPGARPISRLMRHAHTRATALPPDLVEAQARANSACEKVWREARRIADFALVRAAIWPRWCGWCGKRRRRSAPALGLTPV